MGVIKITPRRESLQSGHAVGAGQVHIPSLPTSRNTGEIQKWRGVGNLGRGVSDLGDKMLKIAVSLQEERNEMELNEFESDFLNSLRGVTMDPEKGLFTRNLSSSKDIDALANDGPKAVKDVFDEVAERHGFTGNKRTWAEHRVRGTVLSTQGRIVERVAGAHRQLKITTANNLTQAQLVHWRDNPADQNATLDLIDSYRAQQYASGYDDQAVDLKVGQFVGDIAAEYATQSFKALPDEKAVDDMLGKLEKDPSAILAGNRVLAGRFSTKNPFDPKTTDQLKGALEARRREIQARDMRTVSEAANVGIAAVAQIRDKDGNYPTGRLSTIEASIGSLQRIQAALPKGSNAATRAATLASDLNAKADMIAQQEMIDEYLNELKTNPKAKIYAPETKNEKGEVSPARNAYIGSRRKERLAPMVQQMVDQQRQGGSDAQARKANFANWKLKMLNGAKNPGEYHNEIFKAAEKGELTLDEYMKLKSEFDSSWAQGFEPGKKSPKQLAAEGMLQIMRERIGSEMLAKVENRDRGETAALESEAAAHDGKTAAHDGKTAAPDGKTAAPDDKTAADEEEDQLEEELKAGLALGYTNEQLEAILTHATMLAKVDGEELFINPITGEQMPPDKPYKVNAIQDFYSLVERIKAVKEREEAMLNEQMSIELAKNLGLLNETLPLQQQAAMPGEQPMNPEDPQAAFADPALAAGAYGNGREEDDRRLRPDQYLNRQKVKNWEKYGRGEEVITPTVMGGFARRMRKIERFEAAGMEGYEVPEGAAHSQAWYAEKRKIANEVRDLKTAKRVKYEAKNEGAKQQAIRDIDEGETNWERERKEEEEEIRAEREVSVTEAKRSGQRKMVEEFRRLDKETDKLERQYADSDKGRELVWDDSKKGQAAKRRYDRAIKKMKELGKKIDWKAEEDIPKEKRKKAQAAKVRRYRELDDELDWIEERYGDREAGVGMKWPDGKKGEREKARYRNIQKRMKRLDEQIDWSLEEEEKK